MSLRRLLAVSILSLVALVATACGSSQNIPEATNVETLGEALEAAGLRVNGPVDNDFLSSTYFSIPGVQFDVSGEKVLVYEFDDDTELAAQRSLVSPDGWGIGLKYIQWSVGPKYYQNGKLIVIYDGEKTRITETLATAMGEPFVSSET